MVSKLLTFISLFHLEFILLYNVRYRSNLTFLKMATQLFQHHLLKSIFTPGIWDAAFQFSSVLQSCPTLCDPMNRSTPGLPVHHQLPEFTQTHVQSSQWCHPAISSSVVPFSSCPPIPPSIRVFSNESTLCMRWTKYWSFSFSIIPPKEIPGLQNT